MENHSLAGVCSEFEGSSHLEPQYCQKPQNIVCSQPEYYGQVYGLVGSLFQSSILLVGVLGNLMVVVTVRATKSLHTTTNCYLVSLALADLITLLTSVPQVRQTTPQPSLLPGVEGSEWCRVSTCAPNTVWRLSMCWVISLFSLLST